MGGTFSNLNVSLSGLFASQAGLDITSQNISNVNTVGYTRKLVNFKSNQMSQTSISTSPIDIYSGVDVDGIYRARDQFLDVQYRTQNSLLESNKIISEMTVAMNNILGEPSSTGISAKINSLFQAASDLSANPEVGTARTVFINAAQALTNIFNQVDQTAKELRLSVDQVPGGRIPRAIGDLNIKLGLLEQTHQQIVSQKVLGHDTTGLEDTRDKLLDDISGMLDVNIERDGEGNFIKLTVNSHNTPVAPFTPVEAKITGTNPFSNYDNAIIPAIGAGNNTMTLSVNNGNGSAVGPFTVTFDNNSTIRDVVTRINSTFKAAGGNGTIASLDINDKLVIQTNLMQGALNNATSSVQITGGDGVLATFGMAAGPAVTGADSQKIVLLDRTGLKYKLDVEQGSNVVGSNPAKLILRTNDALEIKTGYLDNFSGKLGGLYRAANTEIPEMRAQLDSLAMNIKNSINNLLNLGVNNSGAPGIPMFSGNTAGDFRVSQTIINNSSLLAIGKTSAASDGAIANEIAELFFGTNTIVSNYSNSEKVYINSTNGAAPVRSKIALIPGQPITITAKGIIDDNNGTGSLVNAGTNGFPGGSLVQIQFRNAAGAIVGGVPINFPASAGPPNDLVSYSGAVPAGAAFVELIMNPAFGDANLANNFGHFGINIVQNNDGNVATDFTNGFANIVGDYGTRANFANNKLDSTSAVHTAINSSRQSISGVSLEEEASNLIIYQNAYSANAKVMSVIDQTIQTLLNIL